MQQVHPGDLVAAHHDEIRRFCRRHVGRDQADDAVQQTFLRAFDALGRGCAPEQVRPWLFTIALNVCRDTARARARVEPVADVEGLAAEPVDVTYERVERLRHAVRAVRALPERQRQTLVLREVEGRTYEEIAGRTGVTPAAVTQLLYRARQTLRSAASVLAPGPAVARVWSAIGADSLSGVPGGAAAVKVLAVVAASGGVTGGAIVAVRSVGGTSHRPPAAVRPAGVRASVPPAVAASPTAAPEEAPARGSSARLDVGQGSSPGGRGRHGRGGPPVVGRGSRGGGGSGPGPSGGSHSGDGHPGDNRSGQDSSGDSHPGDGHSGPGDSSGGHSGSDHSGDGGGHSGGGDSGGGVVLGAAGSGGHDGGGGGNDGGGSGGGSGSSGSGDSGSIAPSPLPTTDGGGSSRDSGSGQTASASGG